MHAWSQTKNLNVATALATCGVDFNIEQILDEPTGARTCWFHLAVRSKHPPDDPRPLNISTPGILRQIRDRTLEQADPAHPVLDCLHGLNTREHLLTWIKRGVRCRILPIAGTTRSVTVTGSEESLATGELITTQDIKFAAALMRSGFPCVGIEDTPGHSAKTFLLRITGHHPGIDGVQLAQDIRSGALAQRDPEHPALWVIMALRNRERILGLLKRNEELILIRNPKSADWHRHCRSAVIFKNSTAKALDQVQKHLRV